MEKNMNKSKTVNLIGRIIFVIIILMIISGILIYTSDRATINNQYKINEADLEIPIFLYHHIVKQESEIQFDYMQTTEETFEKQIDGLKKLGYHFISYQDLIDYKEGRKAISKNSCVLTFDDGGEDIYTNAYPILQKENIPFTMFIITDLVGEDGRANWEQLKEMQDGCFDQDDIDTAKLMIKNSMKKTSDEPLSQVAVQYNRDITGKKETNEQYLEKIENVTYQDIVDVCQNIELDTIFLLKGRNE